MTTHQDNAARLARITQIAAIVIVVVAVAAFLIPIPAKKIDTTPRRGAGDPNNPLAANAGEGRFEVKEEDWTVALAAISNFRDPATKVATADPVDPTPPVPGPGSDRQDNGIGPNDRPPIQYFGALEDSKGFAALVDFAGKQRLLRVGQEFEDEFEITEISEDEITVTDGFREYTYPLAGSTLATAPPNPTITGGRNPNQLGNTRPDQLGRPNNTDSEPRRPTQPNDEGGSPT